MSSMYDSLMNSLTEEVEDIKKYGSSRGRRTIVTYVPVKEYTPKDVKNLRQKLNVSQRDFANCLGVSKKTVEKWESGDNTPSGPAKRMLELFSQNIITTSQYITYANG